MGTESTQRKRKIFMTIAVVVVLVGLMVLGTFAAFTATTTNSGNKIDSGTVKIDQHSGATAIYNVTNQKPGQATARCIRIQYTGSLASNVKFFISSGAVTNGTFFNLQVERGSGLSAPAADMNCTGFVSGTIPFGPAALGTFPTTSAAGIDGKAGGSPWNASDTVDYRFTITQNDDPTANAHTTVSSSGAHSFTWEAVNN